MRREHIEAWIGRQVNINLFKNWAWHFMWRDEVKQIMCFGALCCLRPVEKRTSCFSSEWNIHERLPVLSGQRAPFGTPVDRDHWFYTAQLYICMFAFISCLRQQPRKKRVWPAKRDTFTQTKQHFMRTVYGRRIQCATRRTVHTYEPMCVCHLIYTNTFWVPFSSSLE